jgi:hypothetical protein
MIAIRKEESDVVGSDERSDEDTIVQGIFKKEILKIFPKIFGEKSGEWKRIPFYPQGNTDPSRAQCSFRHGETYNAGNPSSREVANDTLYGAANFRNIK